MADLTDRAIQAAKATDKDEWLSDGGARGAGRLYLRVQPSGRKIFYFRYTDPEGKREALPLAEYSQKEGRDKLTLREARDRAGELSRLYQSGAKDLKGYIQAERRAKERAMLEAEEEAKRQAAEAERGSLRKLLDGYTDHLQRSGKVDYKNVVGMFRLHVFEAFPNLSEKKASEIKAKELREVLGRLIDDGKGRTAAKLRSYLRAAYATAIGAETDPSAYSGLLGFGVDSNPAAALASLARYNKAGERTLTEEELKLYLIGLDFFPLMTRQALKLALYLGGQRPAQLLRVTPGDVDLTEDGGEIRLRDPKGRRLTPRLHTLPLVGVARDIVAELLEINGRADYLFQNIEKTHVRVETLSVAVAEISEALVECGRSRAPFQQRDIRRTVETMLAGMGVSKELRAQLLSHGLSGVQDRHYDRHTYLDEKRKVLAHWDAKLEALRTGGAVVSNVVPLAA